MNNIANSWIIIMAHIEYKALKKYEPHADTLIWNFLLFSQLPEHLDRTKIDSQISSY